MFLRNKKNNCHIVGFLNLKIYKVVNKNSVPSRLLGLTYCGYLKTILSFRKKALKKNIRKYLNSKFLNCMD